MTTLFTPLIKRPPFDRLNSEVGTTGCGLRARVAFLEV